MLYNCKYTCKYPFFFEILNPKFKQESQVVNKQLAFF